ncbi:hypothetical protein [Saccharopolyspora hattusasensis]|uniref:hypothetical protein n=1 Tax=Saccharopolyspora hattusasensis TaxID=1128679 RepID=UPI003D976BCE
MTGRSRRRRHCAQCRAPLPRGSGPQRRFCSARCTARAYRARRRRERMLDVLVPAGRALVQRRGLPEELLCRGCGEPIYPGASGAARRCTALLTRLPDPGLACAHRPRACARS